VLAQHPLGKPGTMEVRRQCCDQSLRFSSTRQPVRRWQSRPFPFRATECSYGMIKPARILRTRTTVPSILAVAVLGIASCSIAPSPPSGSGGAVARGPAAGRAGRAEVAAAVAGTPPQAGRCPAVEISPRAGSQPAAVIPPLRRKSASGGDTCLGREVGQRWRHRRRRAVSQRRGHRQRWQRKTLVGQPQWGKRRFGRIFGRQQFFDEDGEPMTTGAWGDGVERLVTQRAAPVAMTLPPSQPLPICASQSAGSYTDDKCAIDWQRCAEVVHPRSLVPPSWLCKISPAARCMRRWNNL